MGIHRGKEASTLHKEKLFVRLWTERRNAGEARPTLTRANAVLIMALPPGGSVKETGGLHRTTVGRLLNRIYGPTDPATVTAPPGVTKESVEVLGALLTEVSTAIRRQGYALANIERTLNRFRDEVCGSKQDAAQSNGTGAQHVHG